MEKKIMIGFDIGGTKCAIVIGEEKDGTLRIQDKKTFETPFDISPYEVLDKMCELAFDMTNDFQKIGISCGGTIKF